MEPSTKNGKHTLRIAIIVATVLVLIVVAFIMFTSTNESKPGNNVITKKDTISSKTIVKEDPAISEDSTNQEELNKRKDSIWWETENGGKWLCDRDKGYAKEQARFAKVLNEASDEELFVVLNYAIAQHYVPNRDIDPFYSMGVMVGCWQRTLIVYRNLSDRKDLLKKIYPDLKVLDEYVNWGRHGEPYPNDKVAQTILNNVKQESRKMNDTLRSKYFGTSLMRF